MAERIITLQTDSPQLEFNSVPKKEVGAEDVRVIAALCATTTVNGEPGIVMQQRSLEKTEFPGHYTFLVSGHVNESDMNQTPPEGNGTYDQRMGLIAIGREAQEEMNLTGTADISPTTINTFVSIEQKKDIQVPKYLLVGTQHLTEEQIQKLKPDPTEVAGITVCPLSHLRSELALPPEQRSMQFTTPFEQYCQQILLPSQNVQLP